jgi:hypothetical protein
MTGELSGAGLSGTAIARLQSQALLPIEDLRATFMSVKRKQGRVLAQFYKLYFSERVFTFVPENKDEAVTKRFNPSAYDGKELEVVVETVLGANASVAGDISVLDTLLKNGKISLEAYVNAYPDSALTDKRKLLNKISADTDKEKYEAKIAELEKKIKENDDTVSRVQALISENKSLKEYIAKEYQNGRRK